MNTRSLAGVSRTCLLTAAMRAAETGRIDRLFADPLAAALAGRRGASLLAEVQAFHRRHTDLPNGLNLNAIRTRLFDDLLLSAARSGMAQVVIGAAGMDTRASRLNWPAGVHVYELDRQPVLDAKRAILRGRGVVPRCTHRLIAADLLAADWSKRLTASGYRPDTPTVWLLEGLLNYLDGTEVDALLDAVAQLTARGSILAASLIAESALRHPAVQPQLRMLASWDSPWRSGTDDPVGLWHDHGFHAHVIRPGGPGARFGRWTRADDVVSRLIRPFFVSGVRS